MSNLPHFHRSSAEYHTPDIYSEAQSLTERKDDYEQAQAANAPETYRDKYRVVFNLVRFYGAIFPFLSALTLGALAFFLTLGFEVFSEPQKPGTLTLGIVGMFGFVLLIIINEAVKSRSLKAFFKAQALKREAGTGTATLAAITTVLSIIGSALGVLLLTLQLTDKAPQIEREAAQRSHAANRAFSTDSARIVQNYQPLIESKRQAIQAYDPRKYRTLRDRLNNEAIALTEKMRNELAAAQDRADNQAQSIAATRDQQLIDNSSSSHEKSWFAFAVLVALELLNLFAHRFTWVYLARIEREGIEFGALEPSQGKTMYEIEVARFGQWANQMATSYGLQKPGPSPAANLTPDNSEPDREQIGFKQGFKRGLNGGLNGGAKPRLTGGNGPISGASFDHLSPQEAEQIKGYLRKYKHVVRAVMDGQSNKQAAQVGQVSLSTVHNVKRCMRVVGLIPTF